MEPSLSKWVLAADRFHRLPRRTQTGSDAWAETQPSFRSPLGRHLPGLVFGRMSADWGFHYLPIM